MIWELPHKNCHCLECIKFVEAKFIEQDRFLNLKEKSCSFEYAVRFCL